MALGDVVKKYTVEIGADTSGLDAALGRASSGLSAFKTAGIVAASGVAAVTAAVIALDRTIGRGEPVNNISNAFQRLQKQAGLTATEGIDRLRSATGDLVRDFDLMRQSNLANQLGISAGDFEKLAASAETLGEAVNIEVVPALELLTTAFGKGQDRALIQLGINVDLAKAEAEYTTSLGKTGEKLSELGKKEAARIAIMREVEAQTKRVANETISSGDSAQKVSTFFSNLADQLAATLEKNPALAKSFDELSQSLKEIDVGPLIAGMNLIAETAGFVIEKLAGVTSAVGQFAKNASLALERAFDTTARAQIDQLDQDLAKKRDALAQLEKTRDSFFGGSNKNLVEKRRAEIAGLEQQRTALINTAKEAQILSEIEIALASSLGETGAQGKKGATGLFDTADAAKKAAEEAAKLNAELAQMDAELATRKLSTELERAVDQLNQVDFTRLTQGILDAQIEGITKAETNPERRARLIESAKLDAAERAKVFSDAQKEELASIEQEMNERFAKSADFFSDILGDVIFNRGKDLGEQFKDILGDVATSFGGNVLSALTGGVSVTTGGVGTALAQQFLSSFGFGAQGSLSGTGPLASGNAYGNSLSLGLSASQALALEGLLGAGGAAGGALLLDNASDNKKDPLAGAAAGAAAGAYIGSIVPVIGTAIGAVIGAALGAIVGSFGGTTDPETLDRRSFRGALQKTPLGQDLTFATTNGTTSLFDSDYSLPNKTPFTGQAIGLVNPFAQILTGGDDKLGSDAAGIFADAIDDVDSFAEALINASALMDKLGYSAEKAKNELTELFLDGKVTIEEFNAGISNIDLIASGDLPGLGNVADALRVATDEMATFRTRIKGVELAFHEMAEIGVDSASEIHDYVATNYPDLIPIFDQLAAAGIDTWEEIANASADQIKLIANILNGLPDIFKSAFEEGGQLAEKALFRSGDRMIGKLAEIREEARKTGDAVSAAGGGDYTPPDFYTGQSSTGGFVSINRSRRISSGGRNASGFDENPRFASRS